MRRKFIAGNWKMNKDVHETSSLVADLKARMQNFKAEVDVAVCPPFTSLATAAWLIRETPLKLGAQNKSHQDDGAYTGEVSGKMLAAVGCKYVILGHSERRQYFQETDALVNAKVKKALSVGLTPIVCVGETLEERESNRTDDIVSKQIRGVLHELSAADIGRSVIAYEPVWAIGTGKTATPDQANQVHRLIRKLVSSLYSDQVSQELIVLYGGSMNAQNAGELLQQPDIDGGLIGGASLKADSFWSIIQAAVNSSSV